MTHDDDDPVVLQYSSLYNVNFRGRKTIRGVTWDDWRRYDEETRQELITEALYELVDIGVADDE